MPQMRRPLGWSTPDGYPTGIQQKILASDLDDQGEAGCLLFEVHYYDAART
jgi:hypothetical protein